MYPSGCIMWVGARPIKTWLCSLNFSPPKAIEAHSNGEKSNPTPETRSPAHRRDGGGGEVTGGEREDKTEAVEPAAVGGERSRDPGPVVGGGRNGEHGAPREAGQGSLQIPPPQGSPRGQVLRFYQTALSDFTL